MEWPLIAFLMYKLTDKAHYIGPSLRGFKNGKIIVYRKLQKVCRHTFGRISSPQYTGIHWILKATKEEVIFAIKLHADISHDTIIALPCIEICHRVVEKNQNQGSMEGSSR